MLRHDARGDLCRREHRGEAFDQVAPVVQPGQGVPAGQLDQVRAKRLDGLDLPDQLGVRGGEAPAQDVGLGHVTRDEHGPQFAVAPVDERGGAYLELGTPERELHHDHGLKSAGGGDPLAEYLLGRRPDQLGRRVHVDTPHQRDRRRVQVQEPPVRADDHHRVTDLVDDQRPGHGTEREQILAEDCVPDDRAGHREAERGRVQDVGQPADQEGHVGHERDQRGEEHGEPLRPERRRCLPPGPGDESQADDYL